ncbi:hypothetical protein D9M68_191200 [compost metagenome]
MAHLSSVFSIDQPAWGTRSTSKPWRMHASCSASLEASAGRSDNRPCRGCHPEENDRWRFRSALYCISIQYPSTPPPCRPNLQTAPSAALPLSALAPHLMATSIIVRAVAPFSSPTAHWSAGKTFRVPPGKMSGCCGLMATSRRSRFLGTACASSPAGAEHGQQQTRGRLPSSGHNPRAVPRSRRKRHPRSSSGALHRRWPADAASCHARRAQPP